MRTSKRKPGRLAALSAALLLLQISGVSAGSLCASSNTGSDHTTSLYMSNGFCTGHCSGHAYAIVQYKDCWCSDEAPGSTVDSGSCNSPCPGYPSDKCGNAAQGLYQYIDLGKAPVGTAGGGGGFGSSSAAPSMSPSVAPSVSQTTIVQQQSNPPPPPSPSTVVQTSVQTTTNTPSPTTVVQTSAETQYITSASTVSVTPSPTSSSSSSSSSSSASSTSVMSTTITPSPSVITSAMVVTVSGAVVTSMVASSPSATSDPFGDTRMATQMNHQLSNGAVAGITVGALAGAALIGLAALLFWWRRRQQKRANELDDEGGIKRTGSVMSKMGLLRTGSGTSAPLGTSDGYNAPTLPQILTAVPGGHGLESSSSNMTENRRLSRPMFVDSRLNPNAIMLHNDMSRTSIATLQDNQDYSRPLEVRNPD